MFGANMDLIGIMRPSIIFSIILILVVEAWVSPVMPSTHRSVPLLTRLPESMDGAEIGLNELHTLLRDAVQREDYMEAGRVSGILLERLYPDETDEERRNKRKRLSWKGLGAAPWLVDRLDALNYTFPTTIQINGMEAVNAILNVTDDMIASTSLEERIDINQKDMGIVISGTTGSGKTLAYLVPLLSTLSDSLFTRQRLRVGAEESVGDTTGDLLDRLAVVTSPMIRSNSRKQRTGGAIATGASLSTLGKSGRDVKSPLALIVVPSRELGVQTAMLLYELVGGNIRDELPTDVAGKSNSFKFKGPKGVRIGCVLDNEEAEFGLKLQTDVAITTPKYLDKLIRDGDVLPTKLRVIVYDEADLALEETTPETLSLLFDDDHEEREYLRLTLLVGASVTEALGTLAVKSRVLPEGKSYIATATRFAELTSGESSQDAVQIVNDQKQASLKDLGLCLYPNLKHYRMKVPRNAGLLGLTRLLRRELQAYDDAAASSSASKEIQRPRVVIFFPDEVQARKAIEPLRDALWGEHRLCVLLPETGIRPLTIMDQFKKNQTSVMLATPNSVRGLDFPALTHVYTLYLSMDDPREYVHLAGRVGRVGQLGSVLGEGGNVISVLKEEDAPRMNQLADELGFTFQDIEGLGEEFDRKEDGSLDLDKANVEKIRRYLEDTVTFFDVDESADGLAEAETLSPDDIIEAKAEDWEEDDEGEYQ